MLPAVRFAAPRRRRTISVRRAGRSDAGPGGVRQKPPRPEGGGGFRYGDDQEELDVLAAGALAAPPFEEPEELVDGVLDDDVEESDEVLLSDFAGLAAVLPLLVSEPEERESVR
ncbi:hypothetical protein [Micromonospora coxensis]|uniref:hypothetical protein n=1 Tax=Micromonospora coxensis TaxID=356852 RepID=UPI00342A77C8